METQKEVLTVKRLIDDLSGFDIDAEVQVGIRHLEMTVPIGGLMKGEYQGNQVAIVVVDPYKVKAAFDYATKADKKLIGEGAIVDGTGNIIN